MNVTINLHPPYEPEAQLLFPGSGGPCVDVNLAPAGPVSVSVFVRTLADANQLVKAGLEAASLLTQAAPPEPCEYPEDRANAHDHRVCQDANAVAAFNEGMTGPHSWGNLGSGGAS